MSICPALSAQFNVPARSLGVLPTATSSPRRSPLTQADLFMSRLVNLSPLCFQLTSVSMTSCHASGPPVPTNHHLLPALMMFHFLPELTSAPSCPLRCHRACNQPRSFDIDLLNDLSSPLAHDGSQPPRPPTSMLPPLLGHSSLESFRLKNPTLQTDVCLFSAREFIMSPSPK